MRHQDHKLNNATWKHINQAGGYTNHIPIIVMDAKTNKMFIAVFYKCCDNL
jgi:hypothetical protein